MGHGSRIHQTGWGNCTMVSKATIIFYREASPLDLNLARLAEFFGVQYSMVDIDDGDSFGKLPSCQENSTCVMVSARSLAAIFSDNAFQSDVVARLLKHAPFALVYGVTPNAQDTYAVRHLTDGLVSSVIGFDRPDYVYQVSATEPEVTYEFSGLAFGPIQKELDCGLVFAQHQPEFSNLVSINNVPLFASIRIKHSRLFLLACREIADLQSQTDGPLSGSQYFSRLVPVIMFFKHALRDHIWHNPRRYANFIIDDPLLRKSYGFLNYARLLQEMDACEFTTTIAFIPWNYQRTSPSIARLINARSDRFSVCVHGCDHTVGEFASTNVDQLHTQLGLAIQRMEAHEQSTGVPFAKVMVFPQGKFSTAAFGPLKSHNYLAAVNSSPMPDDLGRDHGLTVADLMVPAVSKYKSFPLFVRRYPRNVVDFAFDLFLGKPALIVEHHNYFKEGYDAVRNFITQINSLSDNLYWTNLVELINNIYLQRVGLQDTIERKILSNRHILYNHNDKPREYVILKQENNEIPIRDVLVGGKQHPFVVEDQWLRTRVEVPPNSGIEVLINYSNMYQPSNAARSIKYRAKVYLRRHLSEARDNHLCRYNGVLSLVYRAKGRGFFAL
jgi:hypothetical protein